VTKAYPYTGLSILCRLILAFTSAIQCTAAASEYQHHCHYGLAQASFGCDWGGSRIQKHVLRDAWSRTRSSCSCQHDHGCGYYQSSFLALTPHLASLTLYSDFPSRDSIPDRAVQRAPRVYKWEEERKN